MSNKMNIISRTGRAINQHQMVEKQPIQRSLAIHSPSPAQVSFRPIDIKPTNTNHEVSHQFTAASASSMSKPQSLFFRMNSGRCHSNSMDKDAIIHRGRGNQGGWNVKQVEEISPFFYVEKSHEVIKGQTASEIATNVCNFLKNNSIDAVYDDEEAVACAETSDHCKFHVHLFKPSKSNDSIVEDDHDSSSEAVLIEVQRRSGCCVKFHSIAMQILCAAKGCQYSEDCPHYTVDSHASSNCIGCEWVDIPSAGNVHLHETVY